MIYWDQLKMKYLVDVNLNNLIINPGTLRFFFVSVLGPKLRSAKSFFSFSEYFINIFFCVL